MATRKAEVEILSDASNHAVMKHPDRNYPGRLIQGDSLHILCSTADEVRQEIEKGDIEEAKAALDSLRTLLWERYKHYIQICNKSGISGGLKDIEPSPPLEE